MDIFGDRYLLYGSQEPIKVGGHPIVFVAGVANGKRKVADRRSRHICWYLFILVQTNMWLQKLVVVEAVLNGMVVDEGLVHAIGLGPRMGIHVFPNPPKEVADRSTVVEQKCTGIEAGSLSAECICIKELTSETRACNRAGFEGIQNVV